MTEQTRAFITQVFKSDPTVSTAEVKACMMVLSGGGSMQGGCGVVERVVSRSEAAKLLGVTTRRVDDFSRLGALRRVYFPGNEKRASGFTMSSIQDMINNGVR